MTDESRQRRIAYLRKVAAKRKNFDFWRKDTDLASMNRRLRSSYSLLIFLGFSLYRSLRSDRPAFQSEIHNWTYYLLTVGFTVFPVYQIFKTKWATKVFEEYQVEKVSELPSI